MSCGSYQSVYVVVVVSGVVLYCFETHFCSDDLFYPDIPVRSN